MPLEPKSADAEAVSEAVPEASTVAVIDQSRSIFSLPVPSSG